MDYYANQNYYDILGVEKTASLSSIQSAKDRLKFGDSDDRAPFSMWEKIDEAYKVLSDPIKREEYDNSLKTSEPSISSQSSFPQSENYEDIYSNSDDKDNSLIPEDQSSIDSQQDSVLPKLKRIGKELVLALPTAVLGTVKVIKEIKKYKLINEQDEKSIQEVKTVDSELIEEYRKKLDKKIDSALNEYHLNYNLVIDKLRYENYVELLNKRIEIKENEVVKKGGLIIYKLQLTALRKQLQCFKQSLEKVNNKIMENSKKQKLSKIYEDLEDVNYQINQNKNNPNKRVIALKKLQVRKKSLLEKRQLKIDKIKSSRQYYAIFKDSYLSSHAIVENFVDNLFVPIEKIDDKSSAHL